MSLATTKTRLSSVVTGVSGTANVRVRIASDIDRADAESAYISGGAVNAWEFSMRPSYRHGGASGLGRTTCRVSGIAHYRHSDSADSFGTFFALLETVFLALGEPVTGFPQLEEDGIVLEELTEAPVALRTGHSAYRARFSFGLSDVDNT